MVRLTAPHGPLESAPEYPFECYLGNAQINSIIFIGPRCTWGPIYGSRPLSVSKRGFADLTDVTMADKDTNSILELIMSTGHFKAM